MPSPPAIDATRRAATLDALEAQSFDLAIVGGGITGAGIARDAALRGLSVALLEAEDFGSGTSSRSSKLIHGGLRYLAQGEVALVRETALERKRVHAMAPHLAEPAWMLVPARSRAGLLKFRAGLATYEKLGAVDEADRHRNWSGDELAREEPALRHDRTPYACAYREYRTDDGRLVLANLRAAVASGAVVASRAPAAALVQKEGRATGVVAECRDSGRRVRVRARCVVNAAGPWVEAVARLEDAGAPARLHLSKGVHVVVSAERLPVRHLVILGTADKRSIFAIPRGDVVYVGTTDTSYDGPPSLWPPIDCADVDYLLEPLHRVFDVAPLSADDVVAAWSGLRPLIAEPGKAPSEISRRDEVNVGRGGVVSVAGGKLTGYRKMATSVLERAAEVMGVELPPAPAGDPPLPGGDFAGGVDTLARELEAASLLDSAAALRLARAYGGEATDVLALGAEPVVAGAPVVRGEVDWAIAVDGASRLEDAIYRRLGVAWWLPGQRDALLEPIAARMAERLGWSDARRRDEVAGVRERLASELEFREP